MANLILNGSTSGSVTLSSPAVSGTTTLTLPTTSGTVITTGSTFAGTGPAFSAYQSTLQALTAATSTKILFQTEEFDTNNNFASSRFTPTVAGYYQVSGCVYFGSATGSCQILFYKNGSSFKSGNFFASSAGVGGVVNSSALIYCNGSTDYIELYGYQSIGGNTTALQDYTYFQASMVRSA
jgi:hypothetical protein